HGHPAAHAARPQAEGPPPPAERRAGHQEPVRQESPPPRRGRNGTMAGMTDPRNDAAGFRAARDLLLRHRADYDAARDEFSWPELDEFNWALDWFDVIATEHPDRTALRIVTSPGGDGPNGEQGTRISYRQM